jgi:hypothetical protein
VGGHDLSQILSQHTGKETEIYEKHKVVKAVAKTRFNPVAFRIEVWTLNIVPPTQSDMFIRTVTGFCIYKICMQIELGFYYTVKGYISMPSGSSP